MRQALASVLQNHRRHAGLEGGMVEPGWLDPCSSALAFDGWRRHGLIGVDEVPMAGQA